LALQSFVIFGLLFNYLYFAWTPLRYMGHRVAPAWVGPLPSEHDGNSQPNISDAHDKDPVSASTSAAHGSLGSGKPTGGSGASHAKKNAAGSQDPSKVGVKSASLTVPDDTASGGGTAAAGAAAAAEQQNGFDGPASASGSGSLLADASSSSAAASGASSTNRSGSLPDASTTSHGSISSAFASAARHASVTPAASPVILEKDPAQDQQVGQPDIEAPAPAPALAIPTAENV